MVCCLYFIMENEIWVKIKKFEGLYLASNTGLIKSLINKGRLLKPGLSRGYKTVVLYKNKKSRTYLVHRLIAESFILNPENKRTVNHKDGDKLNNNLSNLEWATHKENVTHSWETGLSKISDYQRKLASKLQSLRADAERNGNKMVINLENGIFYNSISSAARSRDLKYETFKCKLNSKSNKTAYKLI